MAMPNEPDFLDMLEESILEIQNKCNYFPPQSIVNKYYKIKVKDIKNQKTINNLFDDTPDSLASQSTNSSLQSRKNDITEHISITIDSNQDENKSNSSEV